MFTTIMDEGSAFKGNIDRYNGITIDTEAQSIDFNLFSEQLKGNLT